MKKNRSKKVYFIFVLLLGVTILCIVFFPKPDIKLKIEEVRQSTRPQFDSLTKEINDENNFQKNIFLLIRNDDLVLATKLVDSAIQEYPNMAKLHVYKGMIYYSKKMYKEAISEYNTSMAMEKIEYPFALSKRAECFIQLRQYNDAIDDYRKASILNNDFEFQLAEIFEINGQLDSAISYYKKYLANYPEKRRVQEHLNNLISSRK